MNEEDLRGSFEALRARDRATAPSFPRMRREAERRSRARAARRGVMTSAVVALAAMVLLALWLGWPDEPRITFVAAPPEPLGFLLDPPAASVMKSEAPIDQIGEAW
jgi:hypothetical protein